MRFPGPGPPLQACPAGGSVAPKAEAPRGHWGELGSATSQLRAPRWAGRAALGRWGWCGPRLEPFGSYGPSWLAQVAGPCPAPGVRGRRDTRARGAARSAWERPRAPPPAPPRGRASGAGQPRPAPSRRAPGGLASNCGKTRRPGEGSSCGGPTQISPPKLPGPPRAPAPAIPRKALQTAGNLRGRGAVPQPKNCARGVLLEGGL